MSKKTIIIIIIGEALLIIGVLIYSFLTNREDEKIVQEEPIVWESGVFYEPIIEFDYPLYSGSMFIMDYSRPPLLARYYIVPAKEGRVARFYEEALKEEFEVWDNLLVQGSLYFVMSNTEMKKYTTEEEIDSLEAEERFAEGELMMVEVGLMPHTIWNYIAYNTRRPGTTEETVVVFWYFYPKEF